MRHLLSVFAIPLIAVSHANHVVPRRAATLSDSAAVALLDEHYQAAVEKNDVAGMDSILMNDFTLVVGSGKVYGKKDLLESARRKEVAWETQAATQRAVRVTGSTAVVTALLREKGVSNGRTIDKKLWFSDTYVRTPVGWRYFFGQASLALP
jgi:ketosteroid isomerase-like protein